VQHRQPGYAPELDVIQKYDIDDYLIADFRMTPDT
jgi:hypothetical protein